MHEATRAKAMGDQIKWLLAWDFPKRPQRSFYNLYAAAFAERKDVDGSRHCIAVVDNDLTARRLRALLEQYGARVDCFATNGRRLDNGALDQEAGAWIDRLQQQRLSQRGRHKAR